MIKALTTKRQGDSGGSLTYKRGKQHILIGATSRVFLGCAGFIFEEFGPFDGAYDGYCRISHYRDWIEAQMSSPTFCGSGPDADDEPQIIMEDCTDCIGTEPPQILE